MTGGTSFLVEATYSKPDADTGELLRRLDYPDCRRGLRTSHRAADDATTDPCPSTRWSTAREKWPRRGSTPRSSFRNLSPRKAARRVIGTRAPPWLNLANKKRRSPTPTSTTSTASTKRSYEILGASAADSFQELFDALGFLTKAADLPHRRGDIEPHAESRREAPETDSPRLEENILTPHEAWRAGWHSSHRLRRRGEGSRQGDLRQKGKDGGKD